MIGLRKHARGRSSWARVLCAAEGRVVHTGCSEWRTVIRPDGTVERRQTGLPVMDGGYGLRHPYQPILNFWRCTVEPQWVEALIDSLAQLDGNAAEFRSMIAGEDPTCLTVSWGEESVRLTLTTAAADCGLLDEVYGNLSRINAALRATEPTKVPNPNRAAWDENLGTEQEIAARREMLEREAEDDLAALKKKMAM